MRKKIIGIILSNCLIIGALLGCGAKEGYIPDSATASESLEELETEIDFVGNSDLQDEENQEEATTDEPVDDRIVDLTDYSSYLRKVWCMNGEDLDEEMPNREVPVSLVITQIEEGFIRGYFNDTPFVYADYFRLPQREKRTPEFYGTIYDGTAECRCDYKDGREGTLTITFCGDDRIEAILDGNDEKRCLLRPYHITDANYFQAYLYGETIDFETELGVWGTVTVHAVNPFQTNVGPYLFLLNEQGDILYMIYKEFFEDFEILEVIVEDMNEDSLEDMKVTTSVSYLQDGDWVAYEYERPLYQLENGQFVGGDKVMTEESVEEARVSFEGFGEMDYALFLETWLEYGDSGEGIYYRYGIYGDFVDTVRGGEEAYFELCRTMLDTEISYRTKEDWMTGTEILHIQNLSPDLQWLVSRQYFEKPAYGGQGEDKAIYNGNIISEAEYQSYDKGIHFSLKKTEQGGYELMSDEFLEKSKQLIYEVGGYVVACMDEYGKYLAIPTSDGLSIELYSTEDWDLRRHIAIDGMDTYYPLEISQLTGDEESGFAVFSNGDMTYRLDYPDGQPEKLGEYMFDTTYSPDGKYLAYCTGNYEMDDYHPDFSNWDKINRMYAEWNHIPSGWYVREVETGITAYIPVEVWIPGRTTLYGGRCVWIEKDKLFQILNQ